MRRLLLAMAGALLCSAPGFAQPAPSVEALASYPNGIFLENLAVLPDGRVLVTSYTDRTLLVGSANGGFARFATLPAHPASVLPLGHGFVVAGHGASFMDGPDFLSTSLLLLLDQAGQVTHRIGLPQARFVNGMAAQGRHVLIADSAAGTIWRFDPADNAVVPWLRHEALTPDPARPNTPGVNGLKLRGDLLYFSNSSRGALYRQRLAADGAPRGEPELFARTGQVDDFDFASDGTIHAASHGPALLRVGVDGQVATTLAHGCDGCTAVAAVDGGLLVLTTGGLLEGGKDPARILKVRLPPR